MSTSAVITGDLVKSRKISDSDWDITLNTIKEAFKEIKNLHLHEEDRFEIYRGDSFQAIIADPAKALRMAILIRAKIKGIKFERSETKSHSLSSCDARISIGIGEISKRSNKVIESTGEAFYNSGPEMDLMKKNNERLRIKSPWESINDEFVVSLQLADAIVTKWPNVQAQLSYDYLLEKRTQKDLAEKYNKTQTAISKNFRTSSVKKIEQLILRYESLIKTYHHGNS
ncbi:MAG: hypothetical protein JEZ03_05600 [Bacteroidales bacterium]|nr:hypothetical protein [Bacteroidales bacterium]